MTLDLAIQFAHALGAKVIVFSHSASKKEDALKLGADEFIETDKEGFADSLFDSLDFILSCADVEKLPLSDLMGTLKVGGRLNSVGIPDKPWEGLAPMQFLANGAALGVTKIGSKKEA